MIFGYNPSTERIKEYEIGLLDNYLVHEWDDLADQKKESRVK